VRGEYFAWLPWCVCVCIGVPVLLLLCICGFINAVSSIQSQIGFMNFTKRSPRRGIIRMCVCVCV
jgi:hypothetical protein